MRRKWHVSVFLLLVLQTFSAAFAQMDVDKPSISLESDQDVFNRGLQSFEDLRRSRSQNISHERHLPTLFHHGHRTQNSVIVIHGFMRSPVDMKHIAQHFFDKGTNVINVVLTGHWTQPLEKMDLVSYHNWLNDIENAHQTAQLLGKKVIVVGHSLGGLLALQNALKHPQEIKALFLFAPSLALSPTSRALLASGLLAGLTLNDLLRHEGNGYDFPYFSNAAASEVSRLIQVIFGQNDYLSTFPSKRRHQYESVSVPTFIVSTENDARVSNRAITEFYTVLKSPKQMVRYEKDLHVDHVGVCYHDFETLTQKMDQFLISQP